MGNDSSLIAHEMKEKEEILRAQAYANEKKEDS
jgi:hypothetical protein